MERTKFGFFITFLIMAVNCQSETSNFNTKYDYLLHDLKEFGVDALKFVTTLVRRITGVVKSPSEHVFQNTNKNKFPSTSGLTVPEIGHMHGYQVETHEVVTVDGYILTLHRILPTTKQTTKSRKRAALLHHGVLGSSNDWFRLGPVHSLPYLLSKQGIDVWLTNARGNNYSRVHMKKLRSKSFWNFSWHEIGKYDLPATLDFAMNITVNDVEWYFIGHSMGATAALVMLSSMETYNKVLKKAIFLAPLAFMSHVQGPLKLFSDHLHYIGNYNVGNFIGKDINIPDILLYKYCTVPKRVCSNPLMFLTNGGRDVMSRKDPSEILDNVPSGGSMKTFIHYCQLVKSGQFEMYDYGMKQNFRRYGTVTPPKYRLEDIAVPIIAFTSAEDWLSTVSDVDTLLSHFPNAVSNQVISAEYFSHTDFVWGNRAPALVFQRILDILL